MRFHLFPFRTEKLSSLTPMVLRFARGRVGSRLFKVRSNRSDLFFVSLQKRAGSCIFYLDLARMHSVGFLYRKDGVLCRRRWTITNSGMIRRVLCRLDTCILHLPTAEVRYGNWERKEKCPTAYWVGLAETILWKLSLSVGSRCRRT